MALKIRTTSTKDVIKVPKRFARIRAIDEWGRVKYQVRFYADVANAVIRNAVQVRVSIYASNPIVRHRPFAGARSSFDIIRALQQQSSRIKDNHKRRRRYPIARRTADISSGLDNSKVRLIKRFPRRANKILGNKKVFRIVRASKQRSAPTHLPPNLGLSMVRSVHHVKNRSPRLSAIKSILKDGIDPSAVAKFKFPLITTRESTLGTQGPSLKGGRWQRNARLNVQRSVKVTSSVRRGINRAAGVHRQKPTPRRMLANKHMAGILSNFQVDNNSKNKRLGSALKHRTRTIMKSVPRRWIRMRQEIPVYKWRLGSVNKLFFLFELIGPNGEVVDQELRTVNHDLKLKQYFTPRRPPILKVMGAKVGMNRLAVSQTDPIAVKVDLYRKFLQPNAVSISREYELITTLDVTVDDGFVSYRDIVNNHITCVYRAIPVGPRDSKGRRFDNAIARALPLPSWRAKLRKDLDHVSIFAQTTTESSVQIRVSNIPEGPCSLYVLATDKTSICPTRPYHGHCRLIGSTPDEQIQALGVDTGDLFFEDLEVKPGHIYEYQCRMIYPDGHEDDSTVKVVHEFIEDFENENIVISPGNPRVNIDDEGSVSISFELLAAFTDTGFNGLVAALSSAGVEDQYLGEVKENRSELQNLLAFEVLRQDSVSGETETFSVVKNDTVFEDNPDTRATAGVSDLELGRSYQYIATVCTRDPGTIFTQTLEGSLDEVTDALYQTRVFKYLNPQTLKTGTLPSTARARGKSKVSGLVPQDPFLQGKTAVNVAIDTTIPSQRTSITDLTAVKISDDDTLIKWTVVGAPSEVDHFLIMAEMDGVKSTLDTIHAISDSEDYEHIEDDLAAEVGTVGYSIIPVFADYTYGAETSTVYVTNDSDEPESTEDTSDFGIST